MNDSPSRGIDKQVSNVSSSDRYTSSQLGFIMLGVEKKTKEKSPRALIVE